MLLKDKVSLITGAARGIGKEIALTFAREGSWVAICDINLEELKLVGNEIGALGRKSLAQECDVRDMIKVSQMVKNVLDKFGRIDILINNAGISRDNLLVRMKESDWDDVLSINLKGTFNCTKAVAPSMMKQRSGRIINVASVIGIVGNIGQANYAASKAGIIGFTKSIAKELAPRGILVNAIAPGFIRTDMTAKLSEELQQKMLSNIPLARIGDPNDVARVALFLASDGSNYITGQVIQVDGGMAI